MDQQSQAEELIQLLIQITHRLNHENAEQVTRGEGALLAYLALRHDGATAGELRAALEVGSGRVANALKSMEAKGLILRAPAAGDGRVVQVYLTSLGRERFQERYHMLLRHTKDMLERLGEEDSAEFLRLIRKILLTAEQPGQKADAAQRPVPPPKHPPQDQEVTHG